MSRVCQSETAETIVETTEIGGAPWGQGDGGISFFFVEVGGVVFEVMRIEDAPP